MAEDRAGLESELRSLLAAGQKIEAIKLYRERTGAGLAEAQSAVEALEGGQPAATSTAPSDLEEQVVQLLQQGRKIQAVKAYRERMGVDLHAAKEAVEAIARHRGIAEASGSGCLGVVLLLAVAAGIALVL